MSARLDQAIAAARAGGVEWDAGRGSRVLASALRARDARLRQHKVLRRALVVASGASFLVLALFRSAGGAGTVNPEATLAIEPATAAPEPIAARALDDGGYGRD